MPYTKQGPDAPTRLALSMTSGDYLKTPVYYLPESDVFLIVDSQSSPKPHDTVAVEKLADGSLVTEPFLGQRFLCVVRILQHVNLAQLDWWVACLLIGLM